MKRFLTLFVSTLLLSTCSSSSDQPKTAATTPPANPYSMEATTIAVGVIPAAVLRDSLRNKDVEMSIDYPTHGGPYPVVIFSHGYGAPRNAYIGLSAFWASHGYVVIRPRHADAGKVVLPDRSLEEPPRQPRGRRQPAQPQQAPQFRPDPYEQWQSQTVADWTNRVGDITFVINSLPKLIEQYPEIKERVDANRIGVGGHSYGALVAMLAGGAKVMSGGNALTYADPRVKAIEAMSSPGPAPDRGLTSESFSTINLPALFLTGTRDYGASETEDPAWRKKAYELSPAGDKWFVSATGINSSAFTGIMTAPSYVPSTITPTPLPRPGEGPAYPPPQSQQQPRESAQGFRQLGMAGTVRTISLAFWDAYLKNDTSGRDYLTRLHGRSDMQVESK
jgi:dienelactone hydrolase